MLNGRMENKDQVARESNPVPGVFGIRVPCKVPESDSDWHNYSKSSAQSGHVHLQEQHQTSSPQVESKSPHMRQSKSVEDDEEGHLIYRSGDMLRERYEIMSSLGEGSFGKVVQCIDHSNGGARVAVKIIKNANPYREAAISEIQTLQQVNVLNHDDNFACVRMLDWFDHHGHICIVFELLGLSTYDFLKENGFEPFTVDQIQRMAYQIFRAVHLLHQNKLTHTDLKPENILFVHPEYHDKMKQDVKMLKNTDVKLVDFGNVTNDQEYHNSMVSTRHYRAPEVILELGWNQACDVWSLGCILIEFYLGMTFFQTHNSNEHLAMMERVLGPIPSYLLQRTKKKRFVYQGQLDWDESTSSGIYVRQHYKPLTQYMLTSSSEHEQLFDLIQKMLEYDPAKRITLEAALRHPFFATLN